MLDSVRTPLLNKMILPITVTAALMLPILRGFAQDAQPDFDPSAQTTDPPSRVGRLSAIDNSVGVEPASVNQFSAAELNQPLTTGDRLYADTGSLAEVQTGEQALRLGQLTDATVTAITDTLTQFGLAQGSVHLRTWGLDAGTTVELDTPNIAVTVLQPGDVRVDVDSSSDTTQVTVLSGQVQVDGNGLETVIEPGQSLLLSGSSPVNAQNVEPARPDPLDQFSANRDGLWGAVSAEEQYVSPETIGAEDLTGSGTWDSDPDYGPVWYPSVAVDWQPYRYGHWTWVAPWGWTWVESEPWGFAPFHYGRWSQRGGRWGWIPGPVFVRPVYSPALVVFLGGGGFQPGVTAWFPLGPGEIYTPWYHASTLYVNRVNVSNIYSHNQQQVRTIYNQRTTNVYASATGNASYANRSVATVAMQQSNFAAGKRADQSTLRVNSQQLAGAVNLPHPLVTPERSMVTGSPTRAVPPVAARPTLASHEDTAVRAGTTTTLRGPAISGQSAPIARPTQQPQSASQQTAPQRPLTSYRQPISQQTQPSPPLTQPSVQQPAVQPSERPATSYREPIEQQVQPSPHPVQAPAEQTARPLFNKAVPPEPRPSFEQQQQAIQATDPGRPLSPQQLNNIRQNQPVGQPQQRETPHPAPAPRQSPAPAPSRSSPPANNRHQ